MLGPAVPLLLASMLLPALPVGAQSGSGAVGEWTLVWQLDSDRPVNRFRQELGDGTPFPISSRVVEGRRGERRLVFFDRDGETEEVVPLEPVEDVVAAEDGSAWLAWSRDPIRRHVSTFRYVRRGEPDAAWEASATGEPLLFAPDGSLFVLAAEDTTRDRFRRAWVDRGGRVQVVGAGGEVRVELPLLPRFATLTGDAGRLVLLHEDGLLVLGRDGTLAWDAPIPLDHLLARRGRGQLVAAGGRIVVAGTGPVQGESPEWSLHPRREGRIRVFDDEGRLLWKADQPGDERLWFQLTPALSDDGRWLATFHSDGGEVVVRLWAADTGEIAWTRRVPRHAGSRALSLTPRGELVGLVHGDARTRASVWDRDGRLVWEGTLPMAGREARLAPGSLLVAEDWIVRLACAGEGT